MIITFPWMYVPDPTRGKPIFNGSLFFGVVDEDPEIPSNQVPVFAVQEDGTEVAISQPVATNAGGVPTYNGSPVRLSVPSRFSFKVLNSQGSQVYYAEDGSPGGSFAFGEVEAVTLTSGQLNVDFQNISTQSSEFYIYAYGNTANNGRIFAETSPSGYEIVSSKRIRLTESQPAGTEVVAVQSMQEADISGYFTTREEEQTLSNGQTVVTFTVVSPGFSDVHIDGLFKVKGTDYTLDTASQITLSSPAAGGELLFAKQVTITSDTEVKSWNGREGDVLPEDDDYDADQITETASRVFVTPIERSKSGSVATVITKSGGGALTALRENELTDSDTYSIPLANSVQNDETITLSLPDTHSTETPLVQASGSDSITYSGGTDTEILFNSGSLSLTLTSNGVDTWSL